MALRRITSRSLLKSLTLNISHQTRPLALTTAQRNLDDHSQLSFPKLSKQQVSAILQADELSLDVNHEAVLRSAHLKRTFFVNPIR